MLCPDWLNKLALLHKVRVIGRLVRELVGKVYTLGIIALLLGWLHSYTPDQRLFPELAQPKTCVHMDVASLAHKSVQLADDGM